MLIQHKKNVQLWVHHQNFEFEPTIEIFLFVTFVIFQIFICDNKYFRRNIIENEGHNQ